MLAKPSPLLTAAIVPTLARLAAPGIALALFQTAVSVADTYYVGHLGTESLAGLALYFASQGAGQMLKPVLASTARLVLVVTGGALVMQFGGPLAALFAVIALGFATFGGLTGYVVYKARWART